MDEMSRNKIRSSLGVVALIAAVVVVLGFAAISQAQIAGGLAPGVLREAADRVISSWLKGNYESKEFLLPASQTNYDVRANQGAFGANLPRAHSIVVRTDAAITIRFNSPTNDPVTLSATEGQFSWTHLEITNIYLTNTGAANVKILLN